MFRFLFKALLIFRLMSVGIPATASVWTPAVAPLSSPVQPAGYSQYLPLISKGGLQLIVTALDDCPFSGCFYFYHAFGYLQNPSNQTYTVTLEAGVVVYPYTDPGGTPAPPGSDTIQFSPALEAVLPGQINPFSVEEVCYKGCRLITDIHIKRLAPLAAGSYYPLTIIAWEYTDPVLAGTAKNMSEETLYRARIVAAGLERCYPRAAELDDVTLAPGQRTGFRVTFPSSCIDENLILVGQGATGGGMSDR